MTDNKNKEITRKQKNRAFEIMKLASSLPEREQEKIYYYIKGGIDFGGSQQKPPDQRTAAL